MDRSTIVVLQHSPRDPLGALTPPLEKATRLVTVRGYEDLAAARALVDDLIAHQAYAGVIALGGPMGVYDRHAVPHLQLSMDVIADALRRGAPFLGLCLGSQLLAEVLGSPVFPGARRSLAPEVGFLPLSLTDAGRKDPVMRLFDSGEPVMLWHEDTHDLPRNAVLLASSATYAVEAFRVGDRTYGLQFHPEATPETIATWVEEDRRRLGELGLAANAVVDDARRYREAISRRAQNLGRLFAGWVHEFHTGRRSTLLR
ncbi:MAG: glutamine amidotransferase [Thermoleophilia bacterium]